MSPDPQTTRHLAIRFKWELLREIGARGFRLMLVENRQPEYAKGACASHNFCDANMPMLRAFQLTLGRQPAILEAEPDPDQADRDTALWNAAWDLCHATEFFTKEPTEHAA